MGRQATLGTDEQRADDPRAALRRGQVAQRPEPGPGWGRRRVALRSRVPASRIRRPQIRHLVLLRPRPSSRNVPATTDACESAPASHDAPPPMRCRPPRRLLPFSSQRFLHALVEANELRGGGPRPVRERPRPEDAGHHEREFILAWTGGTQRHWRLATGSSARRASGWWSARTTSLAGPRPLPPSIGRGMTRNDLAGRSRTRYRCAGGGAACWNGACGRWRLLARGA